MKHWIALTFDETPEAQAIIETYDKKLEELTRWLKSKLADKGRDMPKFPDDLDLVEQYSDDKYDLLKWRERDMEDARREYVEAHRKTSE